VYERQFRWILPLMLAVGVAAALLAVVIAMTA